MYLGLVQNIRLIVEYWIWTTMVFGGDGGYDVMVSACYGFVCYCGISIVVIIILIIATALFTMFAKIATAIICKLTGFPA